MVGKKRKEAKMKIFVDLDGVLANWEQGVINKFGAAHTEIKGHVLWPLIGKSKSFWYELPKISGFDKLWAAVKDLEPTILSGCPKSSFDNAREQKLRWCETHLGDVEVITCLAKNKQDHIVEAGDILIDDNEQNCERWVKAGGIAILHKDEEVDKTIEELKKHLEPPEEKSES